MLKMAKNKILEGYYLAQTVSCRLFIEIKPEPALGIETYTVLIQPF